MTRKLVKVVIDTNDQQSIGKRPKIENTRVVFWGVSYETLRIPNRIFVIILTKHTQINMT